MKVAILAHEKFPDQAKTATGVLRYADFDVVAVLDRTLEAGSSVRDYLHGVQNAPIVASVEDAPDFDALLIGIAPIGGGFDESWRPDVRAAIERGADVISGLHYFLADDEEFVALAEEYGVELNDVRRPPADLTVAKGIARDLDATIVTTVGTDCSTGKMTATLELVRAARERGWNAGFIPTGQTGIMIDGWGIPIDRTISDFTAGAVERMLEERADEYDYLFVEGQGSITHPAYSAVTCGILHGSMPDALVMTHAVGRDAIHGYEDFPIGDVGEVAELYESLADPVYSTRVVAGALNTSSLAEREARDALADYAEELGAPATDPVRFGAETILDEL
jgi:uncharacterized NAD-dependent epimerase/dehydratase family protein